MIKPEKGAPPSDPAALAALCARAEELASNATPGPWEHRPAPPSHSLHYVEAGSRWIAQVCAGCNDDRHKENGANAAFIAFSRTAVPSLVAAVRALTAERDALRLALTGIRGDAEDDDLTDWDNSDVYRQLRAAREAARAALTWRAAPKPWRGE